MLVPCVCRHRISLLVGWQEKLGKVQTDSEELLIIKTRESLLSALTEHVQSNHAYELCLMIWLSNIIGKLTISFSSSVPEVIALPINGGNLKYLEWIKNSTREN
ncbi:hypothetical protein BHE74_00041298 [Ensete ventricosum]|nr:hypothetical protein GW17_00015307 [Ensete ventricosum]RWW52287.1 hypothetical protein BHE74_00041298 [Ensete ventricosum]RZS00961.1 hypothetical protein BHM03_00030745 [Ensete ventricosum]